MRRDSARQTESKMWDPGGPTSREPNSIKINDSLKSFLSTSMISVIDDDNDTIEGDDEENVTTSSQTELDSHANMPVVGRQAFIISDTWRTTDVKAYSPDYESMELRIVDTAVKYVCPYNGITYILAIRNALHVPSMNDNLIPPFMMREAVIAVCDTTKIQLSDPTEQDHSIYFPETFFRIPMSLWGVFSYFPTSAPTALEMMET
jgi:hypothetical protein